MQGREDIIHKQPHKTLLKTLKKTKSVKWLRADIPDRNKNATWVGWMKLNGTVVLKKMWEQNQSGRVEGRDVAFSSKPVNRRCSNI